MKFAKYLAAVLFSVFAAAACQNKDIEIAAPAIAPVDASTISGRLEGNDYVWTWSARQGLQMQVSVCEGTVVRSTEVVPGDSFTHRNIETNIEYT